LLCKSVLSNFALGAAKVKTGSRAPEDTSLFSGLGAGAQDFDGSGKEYRDTAHEKHVKAAQARANRIIGNDHENIPITLILAFGGLLANPNAAVHCALVGGFTLSRLAHTFFFYKALQPWRAIAYGAGLTCTLGLALNGVVAAFRM
ncbi:hypothetical protein TeGR_g5851, partial [Tetraparma gracilis]